MAYFLFIYDTYVVGSGNPRCYKQYEEKECGDGTKKLLLLVNADYDIQLKTPYFNYYEWLDIYTYTNSPIPVTDIDGNQIENYTALGITGFADKPRNPTISDYQVLYESPKCIEYKKRFSKENPITDWP